MFFSSRTKRSVLFRVLFLFFLFIFYFSDPLSGARARKRGDMFPPLPILFPFSFIAALLLPYSRAERHHLLFALALFILLIIFTYALSGIYRHRCSRQRQLHFYISFCLFSMFLISLAINLLFRIGG